MNLSYLEHARLAPAVMRLASKSSVTVSQRPATPADTEFARSVHHRAYRDVIERQYGPWDEANQDELFNSVWSAEAHEIILLDGVRCGYTCIEDQSDSIYLRELVVDPDIQGRGIGTCIIRQVIDRAIARGVPVRLRTQLVNRAANLYGRMGFHETNRTESHLLMEWNDGAQRKNSSDRGLGSVP